MKIVRTNTTTNTRKGVSFNDVYRVFFGSQNSRTLRIWLSSRLLNNQAFSVREYEYKREGVV